MSIFNLCSPADGDDARPLPDRFAASTVPGPCGRGKAGLPVRPADGAGPWRQALREGAAAGTVASLLSTAMLMGAGRLQTQSWCAPTNATSQWLWGAAALSADGWSWRYTGVGYAIHHAASVFWALLYARATAGLPPAGTKRPIAVAAAGAATAAIACTADYCLTPKRFTPGFEHRLSRGAMALAYGAFGLGIAIASVAWRARKDGRRLRRQP